MFQGRKLIIATQHQKEKIIAPLIEDAIGVNCIKNTLFDTDSLGTFSGEVERENDVISTLRSKCINAMTMHNVDLAIASEGSFGRHPSLFFIPGNEEVLLFLDLKNNIEIVAKELSTETNFSGQYINDEFELKEFCKQVKFPSHGLILKSDQTNWSAIHKGVNNHSSLLRLFNKMIDSFGRVYVETDMRAHFNPTRMNIIKKASIKLVQKIQSKCPSCQTPGFDIKNVNQGLPCSLCGSATRSTLSVTYICTKCNFIQEEKFPNKKKTEDPMYCDYCNP
ncbi:MAG: hypothetical protein RLZZ323_757 [Bacteroidota bacterium]|jgi:hypothetical protein